MTSPEKANGGRPGNPAGHRRAGTRYRLLLVTLLISGCAGQVTEPAVVTDPATLYLLDHGRHSSLVLPRDDGVVRYTYGEWEWYARDRRGSLAGMSAMLWPTRGAMGRRVYPGVGISPFPARVAPEGIEEVFALQADMALVRRLEQDLDQIFEEGREQLLYHPFYDLEFVPYPKAYWFGHQSNQVTAEWLRELGFTVHGSSWFSDWRVKRPARTNEAKSEEASGGQLSPAASREESGPDG